MDTTISFEVDDENKLTVYIETLRLNLKSSEWNDYSNYFKLFTDSSSMQKYKYGRSWTEGEIQHYFGSWVDRWRKNDPFSSLAVFEKETDRFIGHVALNKDEQPGQVDIGYAFDMSNWGKGYGKEAVKAVVCEYSPELIKRNYKIEGEVLNTLNATARLDNPASIKILKSVGMKPTHQEVKFGNLRQFFSKSILPLAFQEVSNEQSIHPGFLNLSSE